MAKRRDPVMKEYYSTSDVARMVNLHRNTIILAIRNGKLAASKTPGGHARVARRELIDFAKRKGLPINFELFPTLSNRDKVLMVDDDDLIITMFSKALRRKDYQVAVASTGYEVGFAIRDFQPDIILLDIMLPDINGIEVCRKIRQDPRQEHIKILGISAANDQGRIDAIVGAGADGFLAKPFTPEALVEKIVEYIGPIRERPAAEA